MDKKTYIKLVNILKDFFKDSQVNPIEIADILERSKIDVISEFFANGNDLYVLKKNGGLQKFDKEKLFMSIGSASDEIDEPLTASDIRNIVSDITGRINKRGTKVVQSSVIREETLNALQYLGFYDIYTIYKNFKKDSNE